MPTGLGRMTMSVDVRGNLAARRFSGLSEIGRAPRPCSDVARRSHRPRCTPGASSVPRAGTPSSIRGGRPYERSGRGGRVDADRRPFPPATREDGHRCARGRSPHACLHPRRERRRHPGVCVVRPSGWSRSRQGARRQEGVRASETKLVIDHVPRSRRAAPMTCSNYAASCAPCNGGKG
jgi:hypothetical protein